MTVGWDRSVRPPGPVPFAGAAPGAFEGKGSLAEELRHAKLSRWFDPFLVTFLRDAERSGGVAEVRREFGSVSGLILSDPVEHVGSVFTTSRRLAEEVFRNRGRNALYAEFSFARSAEILDVFAIPPGQEIPAHHFRHAIRTYEPPDRGAVIELVREVQGPVNERWFDGLPAPDEVGFVAEMDGRLAGVGWASKAGRHVRLHSLTVRAPFRRIGVGTDLLFARLLWARGTGATEAISEIARRNPASQTVALRGGMRPVGQMFLHRPA